MNVEDLFLSNEMSANRARQLLEDSVVADTRHAKKLLKVGCSGKYKQNISRDLLRRIKKRSAWPPLYWADIRIFDLKSQQTVTKRFPFLLPHELIHSLASHAKQETAIFDHTALCKQSLKHLTHVSDKLAVDPSKLVAVALWGDGVPMNFDRSQSLEVFTMLLPGLNGDNGKYRFPLTCCPKKYIVKTESKDDMLAIISWSFQCLAAGRFPNSRHDGSPWLAEDSWRKAKSLKPCARGALVEVRGDWAFYKDTFRFPQHNELLGCCWLCNICPHDRRQVGADALWRQNRLSTWDVLNRIRMEGNSVSPLFSIPFLSTQQFLVDWLHVADQGISQVFLAAVFCISYTDFLERMNNNKLHTFSKRFAITTVNIRWIAEWTILPGTCWAKERNPT